MALNNTITFRNQLLRASDGAAFDFLLRRTPGVDTQHLFEVRTARTALPLESAQC